MIGSDYSGHGTAEQICKTGFAPVFEVMDYLVSRRYEEHPGASMVSRRFAAAKRAVRTFCYWPTARRTYRRVHKGEIIKAVVTDHPALYLFAAEDT
ncbi:MAG: hypothetical protein JSV98_03840 [candidate division WOR-3 bacterium]|nr:MAG: hypothetical protein JSV98_03840 [candidate division WOR-3 bacterium]